ncbi:MAG: siderophore-interacting protein [Cellvibrionaceae bacterium]|nr:siderophore-interacting protein [Cellvibrionaceae bacterium]
MANKHLWRASVLSSSRITPNMQRIVLSGDDLSNFPQPIEGGYIKLLFSAEGKVLASEAEQQRMLPAKPVMRTYTVRRFDPLGKALTVDFVIHAESEGPASRWAQTAAVGDNIVFAGPGPAKIVDTGADWHLLAGDMTALPALSVNLQQLPRDAKGYAIIEVATKDDIQDLSAPEGFALNWVFNEAHGQSEAFVNAIQETAWLEGRPYVWCACEFSTMRRLRKYFKQTRHLDKQSLYISSYWKQGNTEDQHKVVKQQDALSESA